MSFIGINLPMISVIFLFYKQCINPHRPIVKQGDGVHRQIIVYIRFYLLQVFFCIFKKCVWRQVLKKRVKGVLGWAMGGV